MLKTLYTALIDTLFPPRCPLCQSYTKAADLLCLACYQRIVNLRQAALNERQSRVLRQVLLLCNYHEGMNKLIYALKYQKKLTVLPFIHTLIARQIPTAKISQFDYFVPVPLHAQKLKERGFNQTEKIFRPWVLQHGLTWQDMLLRTRNTAPQYKLTLKERRQNITAAFELKEPQNLANKKILLLDDIFTTGTTLEACAKVLYDAGARQINGLVLASDADK